jgi:hypothetical protein
VGPKAAVEGCGTSGVQPVVIRFTDRDIAARDVYGDT